MKKAISQALFVLIAFHTTSLLPIPSHLRDCLFNLRIQCKNDHRAYNVVLPLVPIEKWTS